MCIYIVYFPFLQLVNGDDEDDDDHDDDDEYIGKKRDKSLLHFIFDSR